MPAIVVLMTAPNSKVAREIAKDLTWNNLAACVNILPSVESHYTWKGKAEEAKEVLLLAKTEKKNFKALQKRVEKIHPYEVPEIIALPVVAGNASYLKWVKETTNIGR